MTPPVIPEAPERRLRTFVIGMTLQPTDPAYGTFPTNGHGYHGHEPINARTVAEAKAAARLAHPGARILGVTEL